MKKRSTEGRGLKAPAAGRTWTVGVDLGDRVSHFCVLDEEGGLVERGKVQTTQEGLRKRFEGPVRMRIALEVGTHSPWVSRLLKELGHEVLVANPRKTRLIYQNRGKQDPVDAEALARIARLDPKLLYPVEHRPESVAQDLAVLRARDALVRTRSLLVNHVRGAVKATGQRLKKCSTRTFSEKAVGEIPEQVREALSSVVTTIEVVSRQILVLDGRIRELGKNEVPRDGAPAAGRRSGPDRGAGLRADAGASGSLPEEPSRRALPRARTGAKPERRLGPAAAHHERGRRLPAPASGPGGAVRPRAVRRRTATSGDSVRRCRPEESATRRNEPSSPSHESWPCCCTGCGRAQRSTSRYARPEHPRRTVVAA